MLTKAKSLWSYNPIPNGCQLYLPLWSQSLSGNNFNSIDPYRRVTTVTNATRAPKGRLFNETNTQIDLTSGQVGNSNTFTVMYWINWTDATLNKVAFCEYKTTVGGVIISYINAGAAGRIDFEYSDLVNPTMLISPVTAYNDGKWHCVIMVRLAANSWEMLIDNVSVGTAVDNLLTATPGLTGIGYMVETAGAFMNGTIGEVATWNRALSAAEQIYLYQNTKQRYL